MLISGSQWCGGGTAPTPEAAGFSAARLERLSAVLRADTDAAIIPGAVALIVRDGVLAYHEAFGCADLATARPMQRGCVFRIASMTKPLTVTAALMLMEQGRLLLGDAVSRHLPELRDLAVGVEAIEAASGERRLASEPARRPITVHDLMRHTAGFTYGEFGNSLVQRAYRAARLVDNGQTNADLITKLSTLPLAHQPGTTFEYGISTDVLGGVIEVVSGKSLDEFFAEHITGPLAMRHTGFGLAADALHLLAEPRRDAARGTAPAAAPAAAPAVIPYAPAQPARWFSGGGGLLSTADDYARFCAMLLQEGEFDGVRLLSRKSVQLMISNHLPVGLQYGANTADLGIAAPLPALGQGYGLGVGVRLADGLASVPGSAGDFHWGGALGPYFWVDPAERLIVIFMLQELNAQRRTRYRGLLRALVYQALR